MGQELTIDNHFAANLGTATVQATAHGATAGFFWILNPVGNTKYIRIKKIKLLIGPTAVTAFASAPRVTAERMTFTGISSATPIVAAKAKAAKAAQTAVLVAATTGITPAADKAFASFLVPAILTAVGLGEPTEQKWDPENKDEFITLAPGEGIVLRQPDNGTTSDTRVITADVDFDEYS